MLRAGRKHRNRGGDTFPRVGLLAGLPIAELGQPAQAAHYDRLKLEPDWAAGEV